MMKRLVEELLEIEKKPIDIIVEVDDLKLKRTVTVFFFMAICDSPARSKLLNIKSFNGHYGCNISKIKKK